MTESEVSGLGEHPPSYMIFLVVFLFFVTGLLGFLVCHLLKKKGYRCRTGDMDDEKEEEEEKVRINSDDEDEENQDTVEQILKCIIENEANMEAFNEMLGNKQICVRHDPRLRKESIGGVPPHHHTVHSGTDHNSCHLCAQVRSKKARRQSRTSRVKRPGEQTVFSVGRFRVIHTDKKLPGGPNPNVSLGEQLDQSHDSEEQKEGGYNLRSMFKDLRPSSESTNGVVPNVGKRRKSVTIFGRRRSSDLVGIKGVEVTGVEAEGAKFAIQKQPVVLEEMQLESLKLSPDSGTKPCSKPETKQLPFPLKGDPIIASSVHSISSKSLNQPQDSSPSPEPQINIAIKPSVATTAPSTPSSLLIPPPALSGHHPGPLQTSTPIVPVMGSIPGLIPNVPTSTIFAVIQTPPGQTSNQDQDPSFAVDQDSKSLGSCPLISYPVKTLSPITPQAIESRPTLSLIVTLPEATKPTFCPVPFSSTNVSPGQAKFSHSGITATSSNQLEAQTPLLFSSPKLDTLPVSKTPSPSPVDQNPPFCSLPQLPVKSESFMSIPFMTQGDRVTSPLSFTDQDVSEGISKTAKLSPVQRGFEDSALSPPSELHSKTVSPASSLSPSLLVESRICGVAIDKAKSNNKREFPILTMVNNESSASMKEQKRETSKLATDFEKAEISQAVGHTGLGQPESETLETRLTLNQEKEDMMEMDDIKDCKVMQ